ncbi:MAG: hypothetical protein UHM08_08715 [Bacteroidales bacterium]|nr:hypothetical protein [Bacteroidales bacterium]
MYSERVVDLKLNIDGIVLQRGENVEDVIQKIEKVVNTIYPVKWEIIQEELYE